MALVRLEIRLLCPPTALKALKRFGNVIKEADDKYVLGIKIPLTALNIVSLLDTLLQIGAGYSKSLKSGKKKR